MYRKVIFWKQKEINSFELDPMEAERDWLWSEGYVDPWKNVRLGKGYQVTKKQKS